MSETDLLDGADGESGFSKSANDQMSGGAPIAPDRWRPQRTIESPEQRSALASLALALQDCGFTQEASVRALGAAGPTDLLANSALYAFCTAGETGEITSNGAGVLIQLFVRNAPVPAELYRRLVPQRVRDLLTLLDIVVVAGEPEVVVSRVSVSPWGDLYLLSDPLFRTGTSAVPDLWMCDRRGMVMPPHASTFSLVKRAEIVGGDLLDVGSGCGLLGLVLEDRYRSVTCVDVNPRAVAYSQVNSLVNGRTAQVVQADIMAGWSAEVDGVDHLLFNSPTGPSLGAESTEVGWMSGSAAMAAVGALLRSTVRQGGLAQVLLIVEVPHRLPSAAALVHEWSRDLADQCSMQVEELAGSPLGVSADEVASGNLEPGCLLAGGSEDAERLISHLRSQRIREVVPVVASLRR